MAEWSDGYWWSSDGLRLHYRDYAGPDDRPAILCIPGLTRNARDFEAVAARLAGEWRLICIELRGRGESAYAANPMSYVPLTYLEDVEALVRELQLGSFVLFGTSLGGIVSMLLAMSDNSRIAGVLLNDVGPAIEEAGLEHIRGYVGRSHSFLTWLHAARHLAEGHRGRYPEWGIEDWLAHAKRLCRLTSGGRIVFDYDMRIAEPLRLPRGEAGFDMWNAYRSLVGIPGLVLRGELSDLLAPATVRRMVKENPTLEAVTVPRVGHAPTLEEPVAAAAIDRLLARVRDRSEGERLRA